MSRWYLRALLGALFAVSSVQACWIESVVTVSAFDGQNYGEQTFTISGNSDDSSSLKWSLGQEKDIKAGDTILGTIESLKLSVLFDPAVSLEFAFRAGNAQTLVNFKSNVLYFDAIQNPEASASAGITLTDRALSPVGAQVAGAFDGYAYQARYNNTNVYANLISGFGFSRPSQNANWTMSVDQTQPFYGTNTIPASVSSIESEFKFYLSAQDSAAGTSDFIVVPEPVTCLILALGGLTLARRSK